MTKILHVFDHSIPLHSGYTFRSLAILREQRKLGWNTVHLTSPKHTIGEQDTEVIDGWTFERTRHESGRVPVLRELALMRATQNRLAALAERERPSLIHAHSPVLNAIPAIRVGRKMGIPVLYEVRAFWEDAAVDHGTTTEGSLRYRTTRAIETWALNNANAVTTICEGLRNDMIARGIPAGKITVIPNAVDADSFTPRGHADEVLRDQLGLRGKSVVGFIGSFYEYEGLHLLLEAVAKMRESESNVRLLLVGGGPQEARLKALSTSLGLDQHVVFTGRVPHTEVQRYYDLIDVLAYPRLPMRLTELVTPLKPLEAMAQGRIFVASDVGGHRELVRHGDTGILFKAGDAGALVESLRELLAERERWPALMASARKFVESERTWANSVSRYQNILSHLGAA